MAAPPWLAASVPARPRRSAAERRAQAMRAQARAAQSLLRAFAPLQHRGCRPTLVGTALAEALGEAVARAPRAAAAPPPGANQGGPRVDAAGAGGPGVRAAAAAGGAPAGGSAEVQHSTPMGEDPAPPRVSASPASSRGTAAANARERDVARSPAPVPSGVCTPRGAGLERAAGSVRGGEQVPAASLSRPAEGDVRARHAFFDLVQVLQRQASAPLRLSDASFGPPAGHGHCRGRRRGHAAVRVPSAGLGR
ncbi:unnamed protein product [Prorocentrum cordatum]|uniref:Uncharacterized protein n=1 Tax=Prorocentrum cordatum TaxID=2364126 RepID=A0ABN9U673_9DINO|nr:unnamed protein product [Polarella glacialis]